jgi:hypothetical protein
MNDRGPNREARAAANVSPARRDAPAKVRNHWHGAAEMSRRHIASPSVGMRSARLARPVAGHHRRLRATRSNTLTEARPAKPSIKRNARCERRGRNAHMKTNFPIGPCLMESRTGCACHRTGCTSPPLE